MKPNRKNPLYRKVNTRARGVHHNFGGDYRNSRNKETPIGMRQGVKRGLDYTPLFKFLLSKVGCNWNDIHSEAVSRLDEQEPIYWIVAKNKESANDYVRVGESSYFSGLYVNENNILQIVAPEITEDTLEPLCSCCTHTFNGVQFTKKYNQ
ncbi:MAG: hypothetical protein RPU52_14495 [Candidatus Sedimenticola sp. (ex Thyasira tokunagai)]